MHIALNTALTIYCLYLTEDTTSPADPRHSPPAALASLQKHPNVHPQWRPSASQAELNSEIIQVRIPEDLSTKIQSKSHHFKIIF